MGAESQQVVFINRAGDKPYRLHMNVEDSILRTKFGGCWAYRDAANFWGRVHDEAGRLGLSKLLVMFQLAECMNMKEAHMLAVRAAERFEGSGIDMAVVDLNQRSFNHAGFWHMSASTGSFSNFFSDINAAEQWLKGCD